jgi:predicted aminopeptidase
LATAGTFLTLLLAGAAVCLGSGCSTLGYYGQAVGGHVELMQRARPVSDWLADPATPEALRARLKLSQQMREFAAMPNWAALPWCGTWWRHPICP